MSPESEKSGCPIPDVLTMSLDTVTIHLADCDVAVYTDVLCAVSPYFRNAFQGAFAESQARSINLENVKEQTFRVFLQWAYMQAFRQGGTSIAPDKDSLLSAFADVKHGTGSTLDDQAHSNSNTVPAFDDNVWNEVTRKDQDLTEKHHGNKEWVHNYHLLVRTIVELYVFADEYDVPQLRDDIMTALLGQCHRFDSYPTPNKELLDLLYSRLPASSTLIKLWTYSAAFLWVLSPPGNCEAKIRCLTERNPEFVLEVSIVVVKQIQDPQDRALRVEFADIVPDSCSLHEHSLLNQAQCRRRILANLNIVASMMTVCLQGALGQSAST